MFKVGLYMLNLSLGHCQGRVIYVEPESRSLSRSGYIC